MYNLIEAAEQALEALENAKAYDKEDLFGFDEDIDALRTAIANAQQAEPVAWKHDCAALCANDVELWIDMCPHCGKPRHPQPAQQPLTEELLHSLWLYTPVDYYTDNESIFKQAARAIERTHGIVNTAVESERNMK